MIQMTAGFLRPTREESITAPRLRESPRPARVAGTTLRSSASPAVLEGPGFPDRASPFHPPGPALLAPRRRSRLKPPNLPEFAPSGANHASFSNRPAGRPSRRPTRGRAGLFAVLSLESCANGVSARLRRACSPGGLKCSVGSLRCVNVGVNQRSILATQFDVKNVA